MKIIRTVVITIMFNTAILNKDLNKIEYNILYYLGIWAYLSLMMKIFYWIKKIQVPLEALNESQFETSALNSKIAKIWGNIIYDK